MCFSRWHWSRHQWWRRKTRCERWLLTRTTIKYKSRMLWKLSMVHTQSVLVSFDSLTWFLITTALTVYNCWLLNTLYCKCSPELFCLFLTCFFMWIILLPGPARCYQALVPTFCIYSLSNDDWQWWNLCMSDTPSGVGWWKQSQYSNVFMPFSKIFYAYFICIKLADICISLHFLHMNHGVTQLICSVRYLVKCA